jgi:hypothetical protein
MLCVMEGVGAELNFYREPEPHKNHAAPHNWYRYFILVIFFSVKEAM